MAATPEHRRPLRTDVPGVYRRGRRYVAITRYRGRLVKTYHRTKSEAKEAKARRDAGDRPTAREPFARYAERWLVEYRGRFESGRRLSLEVPLRRAFRIEGRARDGSDHAKAHRVLLDLRPNNQS